MSPQVVIFQFIVSIHEGYKSYILTNIITSQATQTIS